MLRITPTALALAAAAGLLGSSPPAVAAPPAEPDAEVAPAPEPARPGPEVETPEPAGAEPAAPEAEAVKQAPRPQNPGVDARPWAVIVQGGFNMILIEDTPLGRQLSAAGYGSNGIGPSFAIAVQRYVLDWLVVGGGLDLRYNATEIEGADVFSGSLQPNDVSELWRVGASVYVQPTACLEYGSCRGEGTFFGFQLGAAVGPTFWTLRDDLEVGWHVRLEAALLWQVGFGDVLLGFRLSHAMVWQSGMGPRDLGTPFTWVPNPDIQLGYRW